MMCIMKRTTVMLPDDVEARVRLEARRRGVSVAQVVREAVERAVSAPEPARPLGFFAVGEGGPADASERVDDYVQRDARHARPASLLGRAAAALRRADARALRHVETSSCSKDVS